VKEQYGIVVMLDALGVSNYSIKEAKKFNEQKNELIKIIFEEEAPKSKDFFYFIQTLENFNDIFSKSNDLPKTIAYPEIEKALFGDTIVICWPISQETELSQESKIWKIFPWITTLLQRLFILGLERGILLRGSISVGEYLFEENCILGPAISDAHVWSQEADWFGIILTPHCRIYLTNILENDVERKTFAESPLAFFAQNELICVEYPVPLHQGEKKLFALSWPIHFLSEGEGSKKSGLVMLANCLLDKQIPKGTESKYENSINFFKWFEREKWPNIREWTKKTDYQFSKK
jgi:hypothetical protein